MEKALLISDDITGNNEDDECQSDRKRLLRAPIAASSQVLVTFRGVAVDEHIVRYAQQRARELGRSYSGTLHALLTRDRAAETYAASVRAGIGANRYEHRALGGSALTALQAALDALATADAHVLHCVSRASSDVG